MSDRGGRAPSGRRPPAGGAPAPSRSATATRRASPSRRRPHPRRRRRPAPGGARSGSIGHAGGLLARRRPRCPTDEEVAEPRGARARRAGPRSRTRGVPRGPAARRPRRAHRPPQPPLLPRDARARGRARAALRPPARADHARHRRLQGDQRPDRPPGRRRRARRASPNGSATVVRYGRHRLPRRRRRVRGHAPGVAARGRRAALPAHPVRGRLGGLRPGRAGAALGGHRGAQARGRRGRALPARRRGALPRQGEAARARCSRRRARPAAGRSSRAPASGAAPKPTAAGDLLSAPDEGAHVLEEARAIGLKLLREEVAWWGRRRLLVGRRALAFTGSSRTFLAHVAVDHVDNSSRRPRTAPRAPTPPATEPVYASPGHRRSPFRGMPHEVLRKERENRGGYLRARDRAPEALVVDDQPVLVDDQLGREAVRGVAVAVLGQPLVRAARARSSDGAPATAARRRRSRAFPPTARRRRRIGSVLVAGVKPRSTSTQSENSAACPCRTTDRRSRAACGRRRSGTRSARRRPGWPSRGRRRPSSGSRPAPSPRPQGRCRRASSRRPPGRARRARCPPR